ncbi:hypothetical protein VOLCADRAFT_120010 [Volvox carteri f. nagariensis]|uniref:Transcription elongation factor spt6 n=1 Tax=Volvox carteri f. nagariensis TaxID=3068 RepID=D8UJ15_VOLCA|nr:uncharacterized protein VOLCADRAFT_120010 [Volvox carteri f. nagariensis]EFJ40270.1 hypothetical protein VOLCADRAFT_120010 [Volvox carteri f. nagariensis]|eukprot:XP_002958667.1 hypothetical protein VOLCADRAFT_120010 [Volvox carteri f. nagariensis]
MSDNEDLEDQIADQHADEDGGEAAAEGDGGEAAALVEGEADEEEEAEFQDSSEEDDDEEQNEYEADGFIVDEPEEEEEEEEERREAPRRRKRKKRERQLRLDDDDYDLLEENQVQGIRRPTGRKRLKSKAEDARKANDAADIQKELFGYEELEDEVEDAGGREDRRDTYEQGGEEDFDDLDEQDEMADFIVEGDDGAPRRRHRRRAAEIPGVSSRAMQDAFDIFGDVDALMEMYSAARQRPAGPADGGDVGLDAEGALEDEEDEYLEDEDEAAAEARRQRRQQRQRDKTYKQAMKVMDPEQLARAHLRPEDQEIKDRDIPERLQEVLGLDGGAGGAAAGAGFGLDLDAAADWIYTTMRDNNTPEWQLLARGVEEIDGTYDSSTASGRLDDPHAGEHRGEVEGEDVLGGPREVLLRLSFHRAVLMPRSEVGMKGWSEEEIRHGRVRQAIRQVLTQFFERHEEVPVVAMYRKELAGPLLAMAADDVPLVTTQEELERQRGVRCKQSYDQGFVQPHHRRIRRWAVLWAVFDLALKFRSLTQRRERAAAALARSRDLLHSMMVDIDPLGERAAQLDFDLRALDECQDALQTAGSSEALADVQQRMSQVLSAYPEELVSDFCLTSPQFVANLADAGQGGPVHEPPTPGGSVLDWATSALESFKARHPEVCYENVAISSFTADNLVSQVRAAAVANLVNDAGVRTFLRNEFFRFAVVSSDATEAGQAVLDPFHKYALAARLRKKPLHSFGGSDLMLRLEEANRERLANLLLHLEKGQQEKLVGDVAELYQSSDRAAVAQQWNTLRLEIVKSALEQHLLPAFRTHFQAKLLADARESALRQYSDALWQVATAGPLRLPLADAEDEFLTNPRLCIVVYGNQEVNPATGQPNNTAVVFLNELGNLVDFFFAGQLSGNLRRSGQGAGAVFTDPAKASTCVCSKDANRIREKLLEHLPHAVLLHEDIRNIGDSLLEHSADALQDHETRGIYCYPVDEKLAKLWENSRAARSELREHAPLVRRAVGLGRGALDPLALLAALCGPDREVLSLNVYDMQDALGKDERMAAVTRVMVTATAQGFDSPFSLALPTRPREKGEATTKRRADEHRPREQQVLVRPIRHPMFKNVSQVDANAALGKEDVVVGSCIIRPNVRGNPNVLDVSIKTAHGPASGIPTIMVVQLQEGDKPQGRAAHLTLAPPFSVDLNYCGLGTAKYEDLDQVVAEFVEPLVQNCMAVTSHRKYMDAAQAVVEDRIRQEKQANPKVHPYYLTIHKSVHKEPFHATPKGFYFRSKTFTDIEHVLATFKKQPVDPSKRAGAHRGSEAAGGYPSGPGGGGGGHRDMPRMRTGMQGGGQYGGGMPYGQYGSYYGGGGGGVGGSQYPPTQAYGGGHGMYGGGGQHYTGGRGGGGGYPPPPPPYGSQGAGSYQYGQQGGGGGGYSGW